MRNTVWTALALALFSSAALAGTPMSHDSAGSSNASEAAFSRLDTNHDGVISEKEAAADKNVAKQFSKADANHDGKLEQSEFAAMTMEPAQHEEDSGQYQEQEQDQSGGEPGSD